jgi:hypothetical protein
VNLTLTTIVLHPMIPRYGYVGTAVVLSVASTVSFLAMLVLAHKNRSE